jgi:hypothetical protein
VQLAQPLSNKVAGSKSRSSSKASTAATLTSLTTVLATVLAIVTSVVATVVASIVAALAAVLAAVLAIVTSIVTTVVTTVVTAVVTAVVAAVVGNLEPDTVVLGATLSDGHEYRLVVTGGCHAADTVETLGETRLEISAQETLTVAGVVDTLEESKLLSVEGLVLVRVASEVLDCDVGVSNNFTVTEGLRGGVVGFVRVGEGSGLQVADLDGELNGAVGLDNVVVLRASKDGRNHLTGGRDFSHGCEKLDDDGL